MENLYSRNNKSQKNGSDWKDHQKQFGLKPANASDGAAWITDFDSIEDGKYLIYDMADVSAAINTGVEIEIDDGVGEAGIDYYTVTFYDGSAAYGEDTPQAPQIVLKGQAASKPSEAPVKAGHEFAEWVTADGGAQPMTLMTGEAYGE